VSLANAGRSLHAAIDEIQVEWLLLFALMRLEDEQSVAIPDDIAERITHASTKGEFVRLVCELLPTATARSFDCDVVGDALDREVSGDRIRVTLPDERPLIELLDSDRHEARVKQYQYLP
jgi:hypothetical protein